MSTEAQATTVTEQKTNDKEFNFRQLETKYEKIVAQERAEKERLARELEEAKRTKQGIAEEDDDSEPYVDNKRLEKKLSSFERRLEEKIDKKAEEKARMLLEKKDKEAWLNENQDFYEVMQQHAEKFVQRAPKLAENILRMPDTFERQQLVYNNIKALGIDKPEQKVSSIQEKVDANRRSPYYQPTGIAPAPYSTAGDFTDSGKKNAYAKMKEMQQRLTQH